MLKGFRDFILRGNVVDLAVGRHHRRCLRTVVTSLVKDVLTPFIGNSSASRTSVRRDPSCRPHQGRQFPQCGDRLPHGGSAGLLLHRPPVQRADGAIQEAGPMRLPPQNLPRVPQRHSHRASAAPLHPARRLMRREFARYPRSLNPVPAAAAKKQRAHERQHATAGHHGQRVRRINSAATTPRPAAHPAAAIPESTSRKCSSPARASRRTTRC